MFRFGGDANTSYSDGEVVEVHAFPRGTGVVAWRQLRQADAGDGLRCAPRKVRFTHLVRRWRH